MGPAAACLAGRAGGANKILQRIENRAKSNSLISNIHIQSQQK